MKWLRENLFAGWVSGVFSAILIVILLYGAAWLEGKVLGYEGGCRPEPITVNTPTGIAGCVVYGEGVALTKSDRWRDIITRYNLKLGIGT